MNLVFLREKNTKEVSDISKMVFTRVIRHSWTNFWRSSFGFEAIQKVLVVGILGYFFRFSDHHR